jgi:hypothetical protein
MKLSSYLLTFTACLCFCATLFAQETPGARTSMEQDQEEDDYDYQQSSFSAGLRGDSTKTNGVNLGLDIGLKSKIHLIFGFDKTNAPPAPTDGEDLDTKEGRFAVGTDPRQEWSFTFGYGLWGQAQKIATNTLSVDVLWSLKNWVLSLEPQARFVTLVYTDATTNAKKTQTFTNPSLGASVTYLGLKDWHFRFGATGYRYNVDLNEIGAQESRYFSPSALTLSQGFPKSTANFEFGYNFGKFSLSPGASSTTAQSDGLVSNSYFLRLGLYVLDNFDFAVEVGQTPPQNGADRVGFVSLSTIYYWED